MYNCKAIHYFVNDQHLVSNMSSHDIHKPGLVIVFKDKTYSISRIIHSTEHQEIVELNIIPSIIIKNH